MTSGRRARRSAGLALAVAAMLLAGTTGKASAAPLISPPSNDFGSQTVGTASAPASFTVSVTCTLTLPENPALCLAPEVLSTSISASGPFSVQSTSCPASLVGVIPFAPTTCSIEVVFKPTVAGSATGVLSTGGPTAQLLGTGVAVSGGGSSGGGAPPTPPPPLPPAPAQPTLKGVKLDRRRGTATVAVVVPGPGTLTLSGKGIAPLPHAPGAAPLATVGAAGVVKLKIAVRGAAGRALAKTGRATVKATITFTPSGGTSTSLVVTVHLKRAG
ncbi:MAG: hypothetical protein JST31_01340 [Actinobacteria bacterium]|nr:hypothetical protein [Actinomycetota bacterium]